MDHMGTAPERKQDGEHRVNSTKLVLGGIALMVIGVSAFLHSLGHGGGYAATLTFIAGAAVFVNRMRQVFPEETVQKTIVRRAKKWRP